MIAGAGPRFGLTEERGREEHENHEMLVRMLAQHFPSHVHGLGCLTERAFYHFR